MHFFIILLNTVVWNADVLQVKYTELTKCIIPAAVNHTDINIETNWASRIELDVFNILRYCKISGTVIKRRARRNLSPANKVIILILLLLI